MFYIRIVDATIEQFFISYTIAQGAEMRESAPSQTPSPSQTLSRGITLLEVLAEADEPLPIAELTARLGVHRSITYRLLRTLEDHRLVTRTQSGTYRLGAGLAALARGVSRDLQAAALPELGALAGALGMTAFVAVRDLDEVITVASVEPTGAAAAVAQRPGSRHPVRRGAPGLAIQMLLLERGDAVDPDRHDDVRRACRAGYAASRGEVIPGLSSIAVPLDLPGHPPAALAVVYLASSLSHPDIAGRLHAAAHGIRDHLG